MIEINLTPSSVRRKDKKKSSWGMPNIPKEAMVGLVGGLLALLVVIHIFLTVILAMKLSENNSLERQLKEIQKPSEGAKAVKQELRILKNKIDAVEKITMAKRISWARKLNAMSDALPRGVWLNKLALDQLVLILDGSAVSKEKSEMMSVGTFAGNLKADEEFFKGLKSLDVSSIQRRQIKGTEIADFIITIKLN